MNNKMWLGTELYSGSYGIKYNQSDINNIISLCIELGIDKIDTAECYGTESLLGEAIIKKRDKFTIATKFGHSFVNGKKYKSFDRLSVEKQLYNSLKLLKSDFIDIYYFHSGNNENFKNEDLWNFLLKKKEKGIIKELGLSFQHSLVIEQNYEQLELLNDFGITIVQTVLNMFSKQSLDYVIPYCKKNKIKILSRMPLAKGLLSGKYEENHMFDKNDQRSQNKKFNLNILKEKNHSVQKSLEWVSNKVDEIVIGSKNQQQLIQNFNLINN